MRSTPPRASAPSPPTRRRRCLHQALASALLIGGVTALPATAATIVVTSPDDSDPAAAGTCTLRQAVLSMNAGALRGGCANIGAAFGSGDTIAFAASAITGGGTPGTIALADSPDPSGTVGGTLVVDAAHLALDGSAWRGDGADQHPDGVTIARPDGAASAFGVLRDTAPAGSLLALDGIAIRNGSATTGLCDGRSDGGGICMVAADLSLTDSRVSGNSANAAGGGIASSSGAITLTRSTLDGNTAYRGGGLYSRSGAVVLAASTVSGNSAYPVGGGGGIRADGALLVADSTIEDNAAKLGSGIQSGGTLDLIRSVVAGNQSYYHGGGIHVLEGGTATVTGSTIAGNFARYHGGGVYSEGALIATNSTIAGNHTYRNGAGVALVRGGTLRLDHATLSQNGAGGTGGGIGGVAWTGSGTIDRSIVSDNTQVSGTDIDLGGGWSGAGNLISAPNAVLGPLQDNGGPTPTMQPGPGSAALDAVPPQDCTQSTDQRGVARPQGAGCDIGALEFVPDRLFSDGFDDASVPRGPRRP